MDRTGTIFTLGLLKKHNLSMEIKHFCIPSNNFLSVSAASIRENRPRNLFLTFGCVTACSVLMLNVPTALVCVLYFTEYFGQTNGCVPFRIIYKKKKKRSL